MDPIYVVKRPRLTEKSTFGMNELKRFTFEVDPRASKGEIKAAVEALYKVRVVGVNTQVRKGKYRRVRFGEIREGSVKTATVRLHADDNIDMF